MSVVTVLLTVTLLVCVAALTWLLADRRAARDRLAALEVGHLDDAARGDELVARLRGELATQQQLATERLADRHRDDFQAALDTLLTVAGERLDARAASGSADLAGKKQLIDARLEQMGGTLGHVVEVIRRLESDRADQLGEVREQLSGVTRTHAQLASTTGAIREALTSSQARGQWGERMAEDVLTAAGFKHGVNYVTQRTLASGARPDVTFLLPGELELHMDVKFPLANHLAMLETDAAVDRERFRKAFLRDVRARCRELRDRGYVDTAAGTLDCVLLFLPNEQIYGYVHEQDAGLLDEALRQGVVLCSPSTLFAVLAVVRQSCDATALRRTSDEILGLLGGFTQQWDKYVAEVDKLGKQLDTVVRTYGEVSGVRRRQLDRQLERIEQVREGRDVATEVVGQRPRLLRLPDGHDGHDERGEDRDDGQLPLHAASGG